MVDILLFRLMVLYFYNRLFVPRPAGVPNRTVRAICRPSRPVNGHGIRKAAKPLNAADASLNAADAPTRDRVSGFSDVSVEFSTFSGFAAFLTGTFLSLASERPER